MNPNFQAALALAAHGVPVFPCDHNKRPRPGVAWKEEATADARRIEAWWRRWPDSLPAFEPWRLGWIAIDLDGAAGFDDWQSISAGHGIADLAAVSTPSGGQHLFFLNPDGLGNSRGALPAKRKEGHGGIDVRGKGGYVIGEGATLPDGRGYRPASRSIGLIESLACQCVPAMPTWLHDILTANAKPRQLPAPSAPVVAVTSREEAAFGKALNVEIGNVATAGPGTRNHALNTAAFNLGQMVASGWGARGTVEQALTEAALASGLRHPEIRKTIASGIKGGAANPRPALADRHQSLDASPIGIINGMTVDMTTGELLEGDHDQEDDEPEAPPIDERLTHVGGILGKVIDYIMATARHPNRRVALSAALPLCGTLMGRRMATPTGAATHLYVISTYPTGAGKQHAINCIDRLMRAANLQRHVGPSQFMSMSALVKHLQIKPLSICPQDEFGAMLAKIGHPRASGHEQGISAILRSIWGTSFGSFQTPAYATAASQEIIAPALSLFGPTTPQELYAALSGKDVVNGFLNRFLVIDGGSRVAEVQPQYDHREVPASLASSLMALYTAGEPPQGNLGSLCKNIAPDPSPIRIAWADSSAKDTYGDLTAEITRRMDRDPENDALLGRTAEIALRCATIRAVGDNPRNFVLTRDHMEWGAALAIQSSDRLMGDVSRYMTDQLGAAEFERKLLSKLRTSPGRQMTQRKLHRDMSRHFRFSNDLERALDALAKSGILSIRSQPVPGGVRKIVIMT